MTPRCYNREPFRDPNAGWVATHPRIDWERFVWLDGTLYVPTEKKAYRYRWPWFTDRCEAWNPGPGHVRDTVPAREGWLCDGCKHLSAHARAWIRGEDDE
jgi:hypothetical protein